MAGVNFTAMWRGRQQCCRFVHSVASLITFLPHLVDDLKIPRVCLSPHPELQVTFIPGALEMHSSHAFEGCTHWNPTLLLWKESNIMFYVCQICCITQHVHIKASLARGYIPRAWRQVKKTSIPAPGKVNYTQAKAYWPTSLPSFMQKTMQKLVTRNMKDEILGHDTYIYNILPTNQVIPLKPQCTMWLHFYRKLWKTGSYTSASLDTEGASDSTSRDITKAAKWHGL